MATFRTRPLQVHLARAMATSTVTMTTSSRIARPGTADFPRSLQTRPQRSHFHQTAHRRAKFKFPKIDLGNAPVSSAATQNLADVTVKPISYRQPNTFISPPIHRHLTRPRTLFRLLYLRIHTHVLDWVGLLSHSLGCKEHVLDFSRSPFKVNRAAIIPAAKALHATMSDALARGDKPAILKICIDELGQNLCARIDRLVRKQEEKYPNLKKALVTLTKQRRARGFVGPPETVPLFRWELVKYTKPWSYPRLVDHKISMVPIGQRQMMPVRQAVVAIASRQRLTEVRPRVLEDGRIRMDDVPGSAKQVDLLEYVTMVAMVGQDHRTHEWTLLGTDKETTLESWKANKQMFKDLEEGHITNVTKATVGNVRAKKNR